MSGGTVTTWEVTLAEEGEEVRVAVFTATLGADAALSEVTIQVRELSSAATSPGRPAYRRDAETGQ